MPSFRTGLALALLLAACGGGGGGAGDVTTLDLPAGQWTWLDVPGARCADGSQTGLAVNPPPPAAADGTVLLFLNGGGSCWDAITCAALQRSTPNIGGPYGAAQFTGDLPKAQGTVIDRSLPGSPFAGATLVFVPYCTGDVHWGDSTNDYPGLGTWHHAGAANLRADVAFLQQNLTAPRKLVVSGSSAGGYGALLAHDLARAAWPAARGYLVDDSGPPLIGGDVPDAERTAWYLSWRLDQTLAPLCPDCRGDLSSILPVLAGRYPADRLALLSSHQDRVIRGYVLQTPSGFERALLQLVDQRLAPLPGARAFLVAGDAHALLQDPAAYTAGGVGLPAWLGQMVGDDPGWATLGR
jgi:hypothetical protein